MRRISRYLFSLSAFAYLFLLLSCAAQYVKPAERVTGHLARVMDVTWSPDGRTIASCAFDGTIRIWDAIRPAPKAILYAESPWVLSVAWSPDGKRLVSTTNRTVEIWDPAARERVVSIDIGPGAAHGPHNIYASWSPDGRFLALYGWEDGSVRIVEAERGLEVAVLKGHSAMVSSAEWSRDGNTLASAGWDRTLRFWDTSAWKETSKVDINIAGVVKTAWSPDGKRLSWHGYSGNEVTLWDVAAGKIERSLTDPAGVTSAAWSPDAKFIATADGGGRLIIWDGATGAALKTLSHESRVDRMAWSPDGKRIAAVPFAAETVRVWEVKTGDSETFSGNAGSVTALAWSKDGKYLATGNYDGSVLVWDKF